MPNWIRIVLALIVAAHGVGHVLFLVPLLGVAGWEQSTRSWLLGGGGLARGLGSLIWLLVIAGFLGAAIGILLDSAWWRTLAIVAAVLSSLGLVLFWTSPPGSPVISALVFNLLVLGSLLILHWPPVAQS